MCTLDYRCRACRFDGALRQAARAAKQAAAAGKPLTGKRRKIIYWKDKLNELPPWRRPCLYHLTGRIDFKACTNEYRCNSCEFDQYFHDQYAVHAAVTPVDVIDVDGFKLPQGFYLHAGHTWVKIEEGGEVRVGLDDFALRLMGPFERIEAPLLGKEVQQNRGDFLAARQSNRAAVLSPVSGVVTAVNADLREKGALANQAPYAEGWLVRVHASDLRRDLKQLMIGSETAEFLQTEINRLYEVIEEEAGPLAADGGLLGEDIFGNLPQLKWGKLVKRFLRS
jgi:glycine cleavage system H lipoate-binding protein